MAAGAAAYVKNTQRLIITKFIFQEVTFTGSSTGKILAVIFFHVVFEKRFIPLFHEYALN